MKQLLRKYTTAKHSTDADAAVKRWNLELNRLLKLRHYEQGAAKFEEMKAAGVTPNPITYAIMFDTYVAWQDNASVVKMLKEIKDRGLKTYFGEKDAELMRLTESDSRDSHRKAVELYTDMIRRRKAGINPIEFTL